MIRRHGVCWVLLTVAALGSQSHLSAGQTPGSRGVATAGDVTDHETAAATTRLRALLAKPVSIDLHAVSLRTAIDAVARRANVVVQYQFQTIDAYDRPVSARFVRVPLRRVLEQLLDGTPLRVIPDGATRLAIVERERGIAPGSISGHVTDERTGRPIRGVTVRLDTAGRGVMTEDDGTFRFTAVGEGTHRITARLMGYLRQTKTVDVRDGQVASVTMVLSPSTNLLDQVVVIGTVISTERKAIPNAITVITAAEIEQRGITKIDQLFRGDVPGLFAQNQGSGALLDEVTMYSRGATALSGVSAGASEIFLTNAIKTYVDGVEMANSQYLSQIDPKSIERIEILTGPQASTIYGSNAINGVMQVFTKRGTTGKPRLTLSLLSGWVENNFSTARTAQHEYGAQVNGVEGRLSYNTGVTWTYMGPWTPAKQTARLSGFGGGRFELPTAMGRVTTDLTFRKATTRNQQRGNAAQSTTGFRETGWYMVSGIPGLDHPQIQTLLGQTLGTTLGYSPTSWWSHELGFGQDVAETEQRYTLLAYLVPSDSLLLLQQNSANRRSIRYTTTARATPMDGLLGTVTFGVDTWQSVATSWSVQPQTLTGPLTGTTSVSRRPEHNTGSFLQTQLGIRDHLFLTYGLRAEWNPNFGAEVRPNYAPRYGVAYTHDVGAITVKARASYGRSTRPPQANLKRAQKAADLVGPTSSIITDYGNYDFYLANPTLGPEYQTGGEGGLELYFGGHGSLLVTRYNQVVKGLIDGTTRIDSVRSRSICPVGSCIANSRDINGYGYLWQTQYLNVADIRNQGWELQGSTSLGPLTARGTYSWTKSRSLGAYPEYRARFSGTINQARYQPGATFRYLPEHTWAFGVTYGRAGTTAGLNVTGTGRLQSLTNDFSFENISGLVRLPVNRASVSGQYVSMNPGYALADLNIAHRLNRQTEAILQVQNLTDRYRNDYWAQYATLGRQIKAGARVQLP
jgi:outer membrane receptor protein involved in Fe transport